ncbi:MAG: L-dopachrome tautomerase-related protein [Saprospiraceae bacterium]
MTTKIIRSGALVFLFFLVLLLLAVRWRWGGGSYYPDLSTAPLLDTAALEAVYASPEPLGNVAVSASGRIFLTIHPESRAPGPKVVEIRDGEAWPFPDAGFQDEWVTPLGIFVDTKNRLWVLDHGNHGMKRPQLLGFDLEADTLIYRHRFSREEAPMGSYLNDLQVATGREVAIITDLSVLRQRPALLVHDLSAGRSRRLLEADSTTKAQPWIIRTENGSLSLPGNWASLRLGADGIALDAREEWLYYAAVSHHSLFRVTLTDLLDEGLPAPDLRERVERAGPKPLSDGLSIDKTGRVVITAIEQQGLMLLEENKLKTLVSAPGKIRWADGCSFGPDDYLYFTDSALPDQMLRSRRHIRHNGPYYLYRICMGIEGVPGR